MNPAATTAPQTFSSLEPASPSPAASARQRLPWLDAARLIAAFGVIVIHCSPTSHGAGRVVAFFLNFAVPFFLLTSLYFFVRDLVRDTGDGTTGPFRRRLPRLVLPYLFWSGLYVVLRSGKSVMTGAPGPIQGGRDLLGILFLGEGAVHLYFIPLLSLCMSLCLVLARPIRWVVDQPVAATAISAMSMLVTGFGLRPDLPVSVGPLNNWLTFAIVHVPLAVALVSLDRNGRIKPGQAYRALAVFLLWAGLNVCWVLHLLPYNWFVQGAVLAVLLFVATRLAGDRRFPRWLIPIVQLSYGIFLSHHLFLELIETALNRIPIISFQEYTLMSLLVVSTVTFACAVALTWYSGRWPGAVRRIGGW